MRLFDSIADSEMAPPDVLWNVGWALFKLKRFELSASLLEKCVKSDEINATAYWALGLALQQLGENLAAQIQLMKAIALRDSSLSRQTLAVLYLKEQQQQFAESILWEGIRVAPHDHQMFEAFADFLFDTGRDTAAKQMRKGARKLRHRVASEKRTIAFQIIDEFSHSQINSNKSRTANAPQTPFLDSLKRMMKTECWEEIIEWAQAHPRIASGSTELSWRIAWAHFELGDLDASKKISLHCLRMDPFCVPALFLLGERSRLLKDYTSAEEYLLRSLVLGNIPMTRIALADTYWESDHRELCLAVLREGQRIHPNDVECQHVLASRLQESCDVSLRQAKLGQGVEFQP